MKKGLMVILVVIVSMAFTACTFWTPTEKSAAIFDAELDEHAYYEVEVDRGESVEVIVDLTVSSIEVLASKDKKMIYDQKANRDVLLATMDQKKSGKTHVITFKNETNPNLLTGTQNSEAKIWIPEGVDVVFRSNLDVGDIDVKTDQVALKELDLSTNVGKIIVHETREASDLTFIQLKSDVGDINLTLDGKLKALDEILVNTKTGAIDMNIGGTFESELKVDAGTDVGDIEVAFIGTFKEPVDLTLKSSVGDLEVTLPKGHAVELEADVPEFTSKLVMDDIAYTKSRNVYTIEGDDAVFKVKVTVSVGDATFKYK